MSGRNYSNTAIETTLVLLVTQSATEINVAGGTGHPAAPFTLLLAPDAQPEEMVLVTAKNGLTYTVLRGWGGTIAVEHAAGTAVRHAAAAEDFREAGLAYKLLYGDPVYNPMDPTAPPTNTPLIPPATIVVKTQNTWGDLL